MHVRLVFESLWMPTLQLVRMRPICRFPRPFELEDRQRGLHVLSEEATRLSTFILRAGRVFLLACTYMLRYRGAFSSSRERVDWVRNWRSKRMNENGKIVRCMRQLLMNIQAHVTSRTHLASSVKRRSSIGYGHGEYNTKCIVLFRH